MASLLCLAALSRAFDPGPLAVAKNEIILNSRNSGLLGLAITL